MKSLCVSGGIAGRVSPAEPRVAPLWRVGDALLLVDAWSPLSLFAASEQGAWYDPSDFSSMFQDSAGTTPVTAVEQPVGKINDKSGNGNHATQATAAARPVVSARKNWFTSTEDFTDAAWAASSVTKTASTLTFTTAVGYIQYGFPPIQGIVAGATVTLSITMSSDTPQPVLLSIADNADGDPYYSLSVNVTTTPTRFAFTRTMGAAFSGNLTVLINGNNVITPGTVVTATDPQIEIGSTATRYQRVTTASDYDTVGFSHYLVGDGIDDYFNIPSLDFAGTVFAGAASSALAYQGLVGNLICTDNTGLWSIRKASDGSIVSDTAISTTESAVLTYQTIAPNYSLRVNGTVAATQTSATVFDPATKVMSAESGGNSFGGRIYGLVILGRTATADEITATEAYIASKSGVTL